jgi:hypothetical protein
MGEAAEPSWWNRNWKWFVPVGCLSIIAVIAAFVALILWMVFSMMKSSDVYMQALDRTRNNPAVVSALGTPIEAGFFTSGSIDTSGPAGNAELAIPISGPKGKGTIYLVARKSAGAWTYSQLVVQIEPTSRRIDLLDDKMK